MNRDEEFGYIKSKVESLEEETRRQAEELSNINAKLDALSSQLAMYRHFIIWARSVAIIGITLLTIKFGDIKNWFFNAPTGE